LAGQGDRRLGRIKGNAAAYADGLSHVTFLAAASGRALLRWKDA
jgi:hypothetical protein